MIQKAVRFVVLFFTVFSIGCSRDGTLENPDSTIAITSVAAIHGRTGHLASFTIGDSGSIIDQVVLEFRDPDITDAVLFLHLAYTQSAAADLATLISTMRGASGISLVPSLPDGIRQEGGVILRFGEPDDPPFLIYLRITTPSGVVYWSVRGTLSPDRRLWFLQYVRQPPVLIDTRPAQVVSISYYRDPELTEPLTGTAYVNDTIYSKVVFSKDVPVTFADDHRARPRISSFSRSQSSFQYRMRPIGSILESGEACPHPEPHTFVCFYTVSTHDFRGDFYTSAEDMTGSTLPVTFYRYTNDIPPNTGVTITSWQPHDFTGQVFTLDPNGETADRLSSIPIPGVTVTIMSGPRAGSSIVTDRNGRYLFLNIPDDSLHLGTHRRHFEPKEVIVHRSSPTILANGDAPNYWMDPQKQPGNILIGQRWPDEVRFIFDETLLPYDLLYVEHGVDPWGTAAGEYRGGGFVVAFSDSMSNPIPLPVFAHELAHAHQHAIASVDGSAGPLDRWPLWEASPEGQAYAAARAKDWAEVGEAEYDRIPEYRDYLVESAAEIASHYWGMRSGRWTALLTRNEKLEETAPNRLRWAAEWLPKK